MWLPPPFLLRVHLLIVLIKVLQTGAENTPTESTRVVLTFKRASDNMLDGIDLNALRGFRVVKQYGRRLVLDLGAPFDLEVERRYFMGIFKSVQSVEIDTLVGLSAFSDVALLGNGTGPDTGAGGGGLDPGTQTPLWNLMDSEPFGVHVEGAWQVTNSTPDVVVAVVDTGLAEASRSLFLNLLDGYDFISDEYISTDGDERDPDSTDPGGGGDACPNPSWHGTRVASILATRHDNEWGMKGVAQNCSVLPVRVLGLCRTGYASDVADAIVWAVGGLIDGIPTNTNPAKIVSLSLSGRGPCPGYLQSAVNQARELGAIVVVAAGNNNKNASGYFPGNCHGAIAVGASTRGGALAWYSNWGDTVAVLAPGGDHANAIMTLSVNGSGAAAGVRAAFDMGTSLAVPHVAGLAALLKLDESNKTVDGILTSYISRARGTLPQGNTTCTPGGCAGRTIDWPKLAVQGDTVTIPGIFTAGNVLVVDSGLFTWSNGPVVNGQYFHQCEAGKFMCELGIFRDTAVRGFSFTCCNMFGTAVYYSGCKGFCPSGTTLDYFNGPFATIAMTWNGYYVWAGATIVSWGVSVPTASQSAASCNVFSGYYVNGIYGNHETAMNNNAVLCRPLTMPSPAGTYSLGPKMDATGGAVACTVDTFSTNTGQSACTPCSLCPSGEYRSGCGGGSAGSCAACTCAENTFSLGCGGTSSGYCLECSTCPIGDMLWGCEGPAATYGGDCVRCPSGTSSPGGYANACTDCPAGTFRDNFEPDCKPCPIGFFTAGEGTETCFPCLQGEYTPAVGATACVKCPAGTYLPDGRVLCAPCQTGTYTATTGSTACRACATGSYSSNTGSSACQACAACAARQYRTTPCTSVSAGVCTACPPCGINYYSSGCGEASSGQCFSCTQCPTGSILVGCEGTTATDGGTCASCPAGKYSTGGNTRTCIDCPAGQYKNAAMSVCAACTTGWYASTPGASTCTACPSGWYAPTLGASTCTACPSGRYAPTLGASTCTACLPGSYVATPGASVCPVCTTASYVATPGASACLPCAVPRANEAYVDTTDKTTCVFQCMAGYQRAADGVTCEQCLASWFSIQGGACSMCISPDTKKIPSSPAGAGGCTYECSSMYTLVNGVCVDKAVNAPTRSTTATTPRGSSSRSSSTAQTQTAVMSSSSSRTASTATSSSRISTTQPQTTLPSANPASSSSSSSTPPQTTPPSARPASSSSSSSTPPQTTLPSASPTSSSSSSTTPTQTTLPSTKPTSSSSSSSVPPQTTLPSGNTTTSSVVFRAIPTSVRTPAEVNASLLEGYASAFAAALGIPRSRIRVRVVLISRPMRRLLQEDTEWALEVEVEVADYAEAVSVMDFAMTQSALDTTTRSSQLPDLQFVPDSVVYTPRTTPMVAPHTTATEGRWEPDSARRQQAWGLTAFVLFIGALLCHCY